MASGDTSSPWEVARYLHTTERGELRMSLPGPTVLVMEYRGYSDDGFIPFIERVWEETFAAKTGAIQIFVDTEAQTGYTSGFRIGIMKWSKRMVSRTDAYCLLVRSRWVAMGIAIVKTAVGLPAAHAEVTTSRETFRGKLEAAVRRSLGQHAA
jgi:hypothetical protein